VRRKHRRVASRRSLARLSILVLLLDPGIGLGHALAQQGTGFPAEHLLDERVVAVAAGYTAWRIKTVNLDKASSACLSSPFQAGSGPIEV
jgi:hypothetical protein